MGGSGSLPSVAVMAFGHGFVAGLMALMFWRKAFRWRSLAQAYARPWRETSQVRHMQSAVLYGQWAFNSYKGNVTIGVHPTGLALKVMPVFTVFHQPLFIPFADIKGWQQTWYLDSKSIELSFARVPDIKIVMPADQVEWIRSRAGGQMAVEERPSPHRAKPTFAYTLSIAQAYLAVAMVVFLVASVVWPA